MLDIKGALALLAEQKEEEDVAPGPATSTSTSTSTSTATATATSTKTVDAATGNATVTTLATDHAATAARPMYLTILFFPHKVGITVDARCVVTKVAKDSQADMAHVRPGFKVLRVRNYRCASAKDVSSCMLRCRMNGSVDYRIEFKVPARFTRDVMRQKEEAATAAAVAAAADPQSLIFLCSYFGTRPNVCALNQGMGGSRADVTVDDVRKLLALNPTIDVNEEYGGARGIPGSGMTALDGAAMSGRFEVVRYLVEGLGANLNRRATDGSNRNAAISSALGSLNVVMARELIRLGATVSEEDLRGIRCMMLDQHSTLHSVITYGMALGATTRDQCLALLAEAEAAAAAAAAAGGGGWEQ